MKKILLFMLMVLCIACGKEKEDRIKIGITQIVEHQSLDDVRQGVIDSLKANGYGEDKIEISYKNAQGDFGTAQIIAQEFKNTSDIVVAISTPSAQAVVNNIKDKPIFFAAITNPDSAGVLAENVTGVRDRSPVEKQVELIKEILPETKKIGVVYNTSEQNSFYLTDEFKKEAEKNGYEVVGKVITNVNGIVSALDTILLEIDVLYTTIDNTIASTYPLIIDKSKKANKPVIGATKNYVDQGALASEGISDYKVGYQTGEMIVRYLKGEDIKNMKFEVVRESERYINREVAKNFKIVVE